MESDTVTRRGIYPLLSNSSGQLHVLVANRAGAHNQPSTNQPTCPSLCAC
uniref:Uncharacterized protein n=1 Tax=Setaria italica TaxID=4555 RepID=K3Z1E0_SETIT